MAEIKLKYAAVMKQLESVSSALEAVSIGNAGSNGKKQARLYLQIPIPRGKACIDDQRIQAGRS